MKKISFLILNILFFSLCINAQNKNCKSCECFINKSAIWKVETDKQGKEYLVKGDSLKLIKGSAKQLLLRLNKISMVKAKILKSGNKVIYIKLINSTIFTQSLGDAGADWYLATLVFMLTENTGYNKVYVDFEEGDHGGRPGFLSRKYFEKKYAICK